MAAPKKNDEETAAEGVEDSGTGKVDKSGWVEVPNHTVRTPDVAPDNTTFAQRAKVAGDNKRVESSESK